MRSLIRVQLAVGFAAFAFHAGAAADTITLKDEVYVKGPVIRLGDIAVIEGENADALATVEVARAALPGSARTFNTPLLLARIREAGLDTESIDLQGARRVRATTMHLEITAAMIAEDLRNFVETEIPWDLNETFIEIFTPGQAFVVPDGHVEFRWKPNPRYRYIGQGTLRGEIVVDGKVERSFYGKVNVEAFENVVVAAKEIDRGEYLSPSNLRLEKRELSKLDNGAFFGIEDLEGQVAKTKLMRGQLVTARRVAVPNLVKRNQLVIVETVHGALTIRSRAIAMSDAAVGEAVICRAVGSKKQFAGQLRADGVVVVF